MKKLAMFVLGALLCVNLSSCQDDSQISSSGDPSFGVKGGNGGAGGNANPAILYEASHFTKGKMLHTLQVCDADGANPTVVVTGPNVLTRYWGQPTWSGDASAISYIESDTGRTICYLKTTGISVVNGKPTAGATNTLLTVSRANDSKSMAGGIWSPTANEIAYSLQESGGTWSDRQSEIRVIPSNGGASELIYTSPAGTSIYHMSWNSDGTKIAVMEWKFTGDAPLTWENWIKVIDRATGNVEQTVSADALGLTRCSFIAWSRAGLNTLAVNHNGGSSEIHTIDLDNPTFATLIESNAGYGTWSPNNDRLLYRVFTGSSLVTESLSTGTKTTIVSGIATLPYWKK